MLSNSFWWAKTWSSSELRDRSSSSSVAHFAINGASGRNASGTVANFSLCSPGYVVQHQIDHAVNDGHDSQSLVASFKANLPRIVDRSGWQDPALDADALEF